MGSSMARAMKPMTQPMTATMRGSIRLLTDFALEETSTPEQLEALREDYPLFDSVIERALKRGR